MLPPEATPDVLYRLPEPFSPASGLQLHLSDTQQQHHSAHGNVALACVGFCTCSWPCWCVTVLCKTEQQGSKGILDTA